MSEIPYKRHTVSEFEVSFDLVFKTQMVKERERDLPKRRNLQKFNKLRRHSTLIHHITSILVKAKIEENPQSQSQMHFVVTGQEFVDLFDDASLDHLVFVLSNNRHLEEEGEHHQYKIRIEAV